MERVASIDVPWYKRSRRGASGAKKDKQEEIPAEFASANSVQTLHAKQSHVQPRSRQ